MIDVVIIGAGPYGLSIAANLSFYDVSLRIFGKPMEMWTDHMPKGMVLKSDGFATNFGSLPLTLEKFCQRTNRAYGHVGHRTPLNDVVAYAQAIQEEYVGEVENHRVVSVERGFGKSFFVIRLDNGELFSCKRVVLATGLMNFERLPTIQGLGGLLTHASQHNDLSKFAGKEIVVIGGGQSAWETTALLHEQGARKVTVLNRRPPFWFDPEGESVPNLWTRIRHPNFGMGPGYRAWFWSEAPNLYHHLLTDKWKAAKAYSTFGPAGSGWLKHRVIGVDGIECVLGAIPPDGAVTKQDRAELTIDLLAGGTRTIEADHVIAATGYAPNINQIPFLQTLLRDGIDCIVPGIPRLNRAYETNIRGLHVAGNLAAMAFGPSSRFIYGTNKAAPQIARGLGYRKSRVQVKKATATMPASA
jgi:thioredoxin reductase